MKNSLYAGMALAAVASMSFAAPAMATPPSINLYVIATDGMLSSVDPSSGLSTPIGSTGLVTPAGAGLNPLDGIIYNRDGCV